MKLLLKSWTFWLFAVPGLLLGAALLLHWESRSLDCPCDSRKETWRLYVGFGARIVPFLSSESERPSEFYRDIMAERHVHAWSQVNGAFITFSGKGLISCGFTHARPLAYVYDHTPAFRDWLKAEVVAGRMDAAAIDREFSRELWHEKGEYPFRWSPP
jgi:hypothetical protein